MGCHALLQGTFSTQGSNPGLLHCRCIPYQLSYQGSSEAGWVQFNSIRRTDIDGVRGLTTWRGPAVSQALTVRWCPATDGDVATPSQHLERFP